MRDLAVTLLFTAGALLALRRPYYGALLWVWIGLMNPHRLGWGFAYTLPFGIAAAAVTVLGMMMVPKDVRWPRGAPVAVLLCFVVWMAATSLNAFHVELSLDKYVEVLKVLGMTLVVASLVRTREEILGLLWVIVCSIGFFGVKGGVFTLLTGGSSRVWGPPSSLVNGNNELAIALIICIPLMYFLVQQSASLQGYKLTEKLPVKWLRRGLYVAMVLCAVSAVGTQSRGAFLAIGAMGSMLWWRSKSKLPLGIALMIVAPALLLFMPEEWSARMSTIQTYDEDASAMGRINAWMMAINIANDRLMGAGFATASKLVYGLYAPDPSVVLVAHSIYFQVLGDHGYIGLVLYLLFWILTYMTAGRLVRLTKGHPDLEWAGQLGSMAKVSLVGFAVGGAFLSLAYWDMPFYIMVALVATDMLVRKTLEDPQNVAKASLQAGISAASHTGLR
ncbi:MAG: putative O-glycosylation ligase, exosortase A system-associated [Azoarcus sp.]|jgi:probable O-glycosylation ligase (exosortase A-associated)|nr:putative O-glycosylation ligase, exosortase A system-associated [Azoarcus sp.]